MPEPHIGELQIAAGTPPRSQRFALNVVWNWIGVVVNLISGLLLSPYLIRKLGADGYGLWALSFAIIDYYWLLDLGFRSATVKFVAHFSAIGETDKVREVLNTGLVYSTLVALVIMIPVFLGSPYLGNFFNIQPAYRSQFSILVMLVTASWCAGSAFGLFGASLEAVQRFDLSNRASIAMTAIRTVATFAALYTGHGLIAIGIVAAGSQLSMYLMNYLMFRRVFPGPMVSPRRASVSMLRKMGAFGIHSFLAIIGNQLLGQSVPVLLGHYMAARFVGFYNLPVRLLQYTVELVARIGLVTNTNAAELAARGESDSLARLAVYPNRYCLAVFMPMAIFLLMYGDQLFRLWVGPEFAAQSAPLLPILLTGSVIAIVGQFNSAMLLQGLGRHQAYARGLLMETVVGIGILIWTIPRYGLLGAALTSTILMILNRAIYLSWLTSRVTETRLLNYWSDIYTRPLLSAVPAFVLLRWMRTSLVPGNNWAQVAGAAVASGVVFYGTAWFICVAPQHRRVISGMISARLVGTRPRAANP
jgi:O-antigen/teichoic acid export membrane protein